MQLKNYVSNMDEPILLNINIYIWSQTLPDYNFKSCISNELQRV